MTISDGSVVSMDYSIKVDGAIVENSENSGARNYTHGQGNIMTAFTKRLEGLKVGDKREFRIPPEETFGPINPRAVRDIRKSKLPTGLDLKKGARFLLTSAKGAARSAKIVKIGDDVVKIDLNHRMAGKTLDFTVEIISVN